MATSQKSSKRYVVAGVGAVSVAALVGVGVFATTLTVSGSQGTTLQAGADASPSAVSGCQTNTMAVEETYSTPTLDATNGYDTPVRTGYRVTNIDSACYNGSYKLTLAVKTNASPNANDFTVVGVGAPYTLSSNSLTIADTSRNGAVTGYSLKVTP